MRYKYLCDDIDIIGACHHFIVSPNANAIALRAPRDVERDH